jgi:hypothetical protein
MSKKSMIWLAATLLITGGSAIWLGNRGGSYVSTVLSQDWFRDHALRFFGERRLREIPDIPPLPEGLDATTYIHARQIVEMARGFTDTQHDLSALRAELAARRAALTKKED